MRPKLQIFLYGIGVFAVYMVLIAVIVWLSGNTSQNTILFGIYTKEHLVIGLAVALVLTVSHERKKKLMK